MVSLCLHCQSPIADRSAPEGYCCAGCATVAALLAGGGLDQYYAFRGGPTAPVALSPRARDLSWLEAPLLAATACATSGLARLQVDVQGIRCSGCVWLIRELFRRQPGAADATVDPSVGRITLSYQPGNCDIAGYLRELERFGYGSGPRLKSEEDASDGTLTRLGICVALTMNAMVFSAAHYFGLSTADGLTFTVLRWLELGVGTAVVAIGGREFFDRSLRGIRVGVMPFELPIALGMGLAYLGSIAVFVCDPTSFSFFDTVDAFITLMLVGRWLQERVLVQNRRRLLADEGIAGLYARRVSGERLETVPASKVQAGDQLVVPPGDLLVVPAHLIGTASAFSLDWINGESEPRTFRVGEAVPAGAFNAEHQAALLVADQAFVSSSLVTLLESPAPDGPEPSTYGTLLDTITRVYVPVVLTLAAVTFLIWIGHDPQTAFRATTAVLVVTCPCALGLAIPLAYQLTVAQLRQRGLFVCRPSFLDRAAEVRRVAFDKTGTLTLGTLRLTNPEVLDELSEAELGAAYNLASRSSHPRSQCLAQALSSRLVRFDAGAMASEVVGEGLQLRTATSVFRLGRPSWFGGASSETENELWLSAGGRVVGRFAMEEHLRADAIAEVRALQAEGKSVVVLSGDSPPRVQKIARLLDIPPASALGGLSPEGKARWLADHGALHDTLLVGDGLNDRPALDQALCCGTPAIDRPTLAARADFYFLTPGLHCLRVTLAAAQRLRKTTHAILGLALAYNTLAIGGAMAGRVGPLAAALSMPLSSILILLFATRASRLPTDASLDRHLQTHLAAWEVNQ